ncbi:MAG: integrase arm-type DNA-binding domain-containing protein [Paracoccaceae bacterium]|nr:integrase arm-type DNA-binding domain-containing protein [Paracoccaceae bacterium]
MARELHKLTAVKVKTAEPGKYSDGGGLWLFKRPDGGGQWILRTVVHGRRHEMGLGSISDVSLAEARKHATKWRAVALSGVNPIRERERQRREAEKQLHLLKDVAQDAFEARKADLKGDGAAGRWFSPLALHVLPKLGKTPVAEIDQVDIRDTLKPIWDAKGETAGKALNRLSIVMRHAAALGLDVDLQACDKAKALLGRTRQERAHIPAMVWQDVPAFYASLSDGSVTHLALRLLILTGVRSAPLRFMRLDQIEGDVWTIPGEAMKGRKGQTEAFRVPLSTEALAVIEEAKRHERGGFLFPSVRKGVISDATMSRFMERKGMAERPHGFRTSLRTWLAEATDAPHEVAEACLAHVTGTKVTNAYRRTDWIEQRRILMERWAGHVTGKSGNVVKMVAANG